MLVSEIYLDVFLSSKIFSLIFQVQGVEPFVLGEVQTEMNSAQRQGNLPQFRLNKRFDCQNYLL